MSIPYEQLFDTVNNKIFDQIYNYTDITLKNNVKLTPLNKGVTSRGMVYTNVITTLLPDTLNRYYLFACDNIAISNLLYNTEDWVNLETVLNISKVNADLVTNTNQLIPKILAFGRISHTGMTIFAIDARAYEKLGCTTETFLVINVDTDNVGERTIISHVPGVVDNYSAILAAYNANLPRHRIGFINGWAYGQSVFPTAGNPLSDYIELYIDKNVIFVFSVNLNDRKTYLSNEENLYKDIIVIPKAQSNEKVITYDTITIIVFDKYGRGVYVPFLPSMSVSQLTHSCFSISSFLIDAALDKLGATTGTMRVIVSNYSKSNTHVENGSLTEKLYTLDDANITKAVLNNLEPKVPYWYADALEKRAYGKFLTSIDDLALFSLDAVSKQIECLGYYSFVKTLCKTTGEFNDLSNTLSYLTINLPDFWDNNVSVYPQLFVDGFKISHNLYTVNRNGNVLNIVFDTPYPLPFNYSIVQYDLLTLTADNIFSVSVTETENNFVIPKRDSSFKVFLKSTTLIKSIYPTELPGYEDVGSVNCSWFTVVDNGDSYLFDFNTVANDRDFVITYTSIGAFNNYPNIDITSGSNLCYIPITDASIILTEGTYDVFLNDRILVKDIDYKVEPVVDGDLIGGYVIVIQNLKFLKNDNQNSISIYKTNRVVLTEQSGYIVDGIIPKTEGNEAWIEGVSRLVINGRVVPFSCVTETTTHFVIDNKYWSNGYIYYFCNAVPVDLYEAYKTYMDEMYFNGRKQVHAFLTQGYSYSYPEQIVIEYGNKLFSSYLNEIIKRIVNGSITVNYINDDNDIINQLAEYAYLKKYDVLFDTNGKIDSRFIDFFPTYLSNVSTNDLNHYLYIKRLVAILLGGDDVTDHSVVYTGT